MIPYAKRVESMLRHLVVGDALGKTCSKYTKEEVCSLYGGPVRGLVKPIRRSSDHEWFRGAVTDDTVLTLLVADSLIKSKGFDRRDIARRLMICEPRGGKQIYKLKNSKDEDYVAKDGETNGASIRVSPLAVVEPDIDGLTSKAISLSTLTHGTNEAISAALFVAYTLHYVLNDEEVSHEKLDEAILRHFPRAEETRVRQKLKEAFILARNTEPAALADELEKAIGYYKESWSSVPTAIALGVTSRNNYEAIIDIIHRNNPMGDLDSVASIAASIMGAKRRDEKVEGLSREIETINAFSLTRYCKQLLEVRQK